MMRNPPFRYVAPRKVEEAVKILGAEGPDAMPIAGGTDLVPKMKRRQFEPKVVVSLRRLNEMRGKSGDPGKGLVLGAGQILSDIEGDSDIRGAYPVISETVRGIAHPLIQNMGTLGGNLCVDTRCTYWDQTYGWRKSIDFCMKKDGTICWVAPSSPRCWAVTSTDAAPVLIALGARVKLVSSRGERLIHVDDLYRDDGIRFLNKEPDELLTEVHLPPVNGWRASYRKLRRRGSIDFPVLGAAAWIRFGDRDAVEEARVVLGGVGSRPHVVDDASKALVGRPLSTDSITEAAEACFVRGKPLDNTDFIMNWRKRMIRAKVREALESLQGGASS